MIRIGAFASILAVCTAAHAATQPLATPAVYGGSSANEFICTVSNFSGQTATLASVAITPDIGGKSLALESSCGKTLADGKACYFEAYVTQPSNSAYYCDVQDGDSATVVSNMRVTIHVFDSNEVLLQSEAGH